MVKILKNNFYVLCYILLIIIFTVIVICDAFFFKKDIVEVEANESDLEEYNSVEKIITENSYKDKNIEINITTDRAYNSQIYIADVKINDIKYLKTAFAEDMYGRNITEYPSEVAKRNNAILTINGDYYGYRDYGYVIRNGIIYRYTARKNGKDADLVIYNDGTIDILNEREITLQEILDNAVLNNKEVTQVFTFGPALVCNNVIMENVVQEDVTSNPRTAFGIIEPLHYIWIVVDGRTSESDGIKLADLAAYIKELGCTDAYNLDGGGSSIMIFNGEVVNQPSDNEERAVSDIVYIGY